MLSREIAISGLRVFCVVYLLSLGDQRLELFEFFLRTAQFFNEK